MRVGRFHKRRRERRRSPRIDGKGLVAYYWTGSIPSPREVRQISLYGARILGPDGFYPGTLVQIVFEDSAADGDSNGSRPHICVAAEVLRSVADGFCVTFLFGEAVERKRFRHFLEQLKRRLAEEEKTIAEVHDETNDPGETA